MTISPKFILILLLPLGACSKKEATTAKATNEGASGNLLTAPIDHMAGVAKAKRTAERVVDSTSMSQAIQLFYAQEDRFPRDLNELVAQHYIAAIPTAPPGTKWAYNPQTGEVKAVRQE